MATMRSIWKGDLSFGLVNVPVKVYSATESHDRKSYQVDSSDGTRIRYRRVREAPTPRSSSPTSPMPTNPPRATR